MSLLFCVFLYVPLELHTLPQHDALATNALVCNTKHICFCHESTLNLITASLQLELCLQLWMKTVTGIDPPHVSSVSFEPVLFEPGIAKHQSTCRNHAYVPNSQYTHS